MISFYKRLIELMNIQKGDRILIKLKFLYLLKRIKMRNLVILFIGIICFNSCRSDSYNWHAIEVTATAYNSLEYQTDGDPNITAWGDELVPGNKYIAVSRDLIKIGLGHDTPVKIKGLEGTYLVKDKMNKRWNKRIDIYMGTDVRAAKEWGRRKIEISYGIENIKD